MKLFLTDLSRGFFFLSLVIILIYFILGLALVVAEHPKILVIPVIVIITWGIGYIWRK